MAIVSLLTMQDRAFGWEHANSHRRIMSAMAPLDRFSVIPYYVDPPMMHAGGWLMDHQTAHNDFRVQLPAIFGWWATPTQEYGIASGHNLQDVNLSDQRQALAWTHFNHMDHYIAESLIDLTLELFPAW